MSSVQGIDQLLGELRSAAALAGGKAVSAAPGSAEAPDFCSAQAVDRSGQPDAAGSAR